MRTAVWAAIAAGPLALGIACAAPDPVVPPAPVATAQKVVRSAQSGDPSGYAQLFLALWLRSGDEEDTAAAESLRTMAPSVKPPSWSKWAPAVERITAVRAAQVQGGAWAVTVAVELRARSSSTGPVRYFVVPVSVSGAATGGQQGFVVTSAPAAVTGPEALKDPGSAYGTEVEAGTPLTVTVGDFLAAYASGSSGADRYLAPGVSLPAISPSPYAQVVLDQVSTRGDFGTGSVGKDGSVVRVLAQVTARDSSGGQWPLAYALRLRAREGRWEVTGLESGSDPVAKQSSAGSASSSDVVRRESAQ
ncbi:MULTISPECIES: conjugal transfer protein [unclassified Streptomyces]|uniref:conjugal transfer protein n=1 Tax=unclassified Streptomyces TaxID=2593676 RepID=UPI002DDC198B|nr:conjugal transfer protein [Streptomyces sp. NBC_01766]WSC24913.1 conjugal transfer protein [Streptomyces sp. NBC_01766]